MARFQYRAMTQDGRHRAGTIDAGDGPSAAAAIRSGGAMVIALRLVTDTATGDGAAAPRRSGATDAAVAAFVTEAAVLLRAGLPLDRALGLATANMEPAKLAEQFAPVLAAVREGRPLSQVMAAHPALFANEAVAMCEAGEANGQLADALDRLGAMITRANELRQLIVQSSIYPLSLAIIALGVVLIMLLFVVPQFEAVLGTAREGLPAASRLVLAASLFLREQWPWLIGGIALAVVVVRQTLARAASRAALAAFMLRLPQLGELIRRINGARFARTLGALADSDVALPHALALAHRTIANPSMAAAVAASVDGVRQGAGLSASLAATRALPPIAIGFIRTGEESSELGKMLLRLADVLDRDVKVRVQRLVAILTPLITVLLGASVAGIVAAIMSAIMGFNELAVGQ